MDRSVGLLIKAGPPDICKESHHVNAERKAGDRVPEALRTDEFLQTMDSVCRAASRDAAVGILYESAAKQFEYIIVVQVVYDTISEVEGEYFPGFRIGNRQAHGKRRLIAMKPQFVAERLLVLLDIFAPVLDIGLVVLILAGIEEGLVKVPAQLFPGKFIHESEGEAEATARRTDLPL